MSRTPGSNRVGLYGSSLASKISTSSLMEYIGSTFLGILGLGFGMLAKLDGLPPLGVSVAFGTGFGIALLVMIYVAGKISGAHFNPDVTIALTLTGNANRAAAVPYIVAQLAGFFTASAFLFFTFGPESAIITGLGASSPYANLSLVRAGIIETVATFFFVLVIMGTAADKSANDSVAGIAIGPTLGGLITLFAQLSGAALNLARGLMPQLFLYIFVTHHFPLASWIYLVFPLIGACAAALLYEKVFTTATPPPAP